MVEKLLTVSPKKRPGCDEILELIGDRMDTIES